MAVLTAIPEQAVISALKGTVDFYLWKGIPVARKWPVWPHREPHPEERTNQEAFAFITKATIFFPEYIIDFYRAQAAGTPWTWRDLAIRAYLKGLPY